MNVRTFAGALLCILAASQLAKSQHRHASEFTPKLATVTNHSATVTSLQDGGCNPSTQGMLINPPATVSVRDTLAGAGFDPDNFTAIVPLFLQEEGVTAVWEHLGAGQTVTVSYSGAEVTMFMDRWRVADDDSEVTFSATITDYRLPLLASLFVGSSELESALQRASNRPLLGHIRTMATDMVSLSLEIDPTVARSGDPHGTRWKFSMQPGGVTTMVMASTCKCCNSGGTNCTDAGCEGNFACGSDTQSWQCGFYESSGEKDIALCLVPVVACLLWKGFRRMCCC